MAHEVGIMKFNAARIGKALSEIDFDRQFFSCGQGQIQVDGIISLAKRFAEELRSSHGKTEHGVSKASWCHG